MSSTAVKSLKVFNDEVGEKLFYQCYDQLMEHWPCRYETLEINTEFGTCHVIVSGPEDGEPILMFHGMTSNSALWYPTMEALDDYRVYCIDTPGDFGKSTVTKCIRTAADAIMWMDQVMVELELEKSIFIGHSMGGWLCSNYATKRPKRIKQLILLAPVATFMPIPFIKLLQNVYPAMLWPKPKRIRKAWNWFCSKGYNLPTHVMDLIVAAYTHGRSHFPVVPTVIAHDAWSNFDAPTLFLVGEEEKIYDARTVTSRVSEAISHAEIEIINKAGHCLIIEQKSLVNHSIRTFLNKSI